MSSEKFIKFILRVIEETGEVNFYFVENFNSRVGRVKQDKASWWQLAKRLIIAYLIVKQILLAALQYNSYFLAIKMKNLKALINNGESMTFNSSSFQSSNSFFVKLSQLERRILTNEQALGFFGHPFKNMAFSIECAQVFVSAGLIAYYGATFFYCKFIAPVNFSFVRVLADEKRELRHLDRLFDEEHDRAICIAYFTCANEEEESKKPPDPDDERYEMTSNKHQFNNYNRSNYRSFVWLLKRVTRGDSLVPDYRRGNWVAKMRILYTYSNCVLVPVVFFLNRALESAWNQSRLGQTEPATWAALWCHVELNFMCYLQLIMVHVTTFFMFCLSLERSYAALKLGESIERCIIENGRLIHREIGQQKQHNHLAGTIGSLAPTFRLPPLRNTQRTYHQHKRNYCQWEIEQINENLLRIVMEYRIYVRHILPSTHFNSHIVTITTCYLAAMPLFLILHAPYWNTENCITIICFFWLATFWHDSQVMPVCYHNARVKHILRSLFNLMAHITKYDTRITDATKGGNPLIYNPFIVNMIRREIIEPEMFIDKLSIKFFNAPLGYKHLLTMHFWTALLSVYALSVKRSVDDLSTDNLQFISENRASFALIGG